MLGLARFVTHGSGGSGPSLNFNFADNSPYLSQQITFTRASAGTFVGSNGLIQDAPVNLLTYSEQFDNAYWSKAGPAADTYQGTGLQAVVTANQGIAPDGTLTADRLILDLNGGTTTNDRSGFSTSVTVSTALTYTSTLYIKPLDGTTQSQLESSPNIGALAAGGTATQRYATPVGNGWFRLVQVIQPVNTSGTWRVQLVGGVPGSPAKIDCLIWGAQLVEGSVAGPYARTVASTSGAPRFDYDPVTLAAKGLLIEEQRTNLFTNSDFNSGVSGTGLVTSSTMTGPTGATITAAAFGHDGTTTSFLYKNMVAATTQYAISVFVRMDDGNAPVFGSSTTISPLNDFALVVSGGAVPVSTYTVENFGGGLYRVSGSVISQATTLGNNGVVKYSTNSNRTFKTSGWQVEAGSFATSYIPTVASQVTRSNDVASVNTLSPWYNATEGTLYFEGSHSNSANFPVNVMFSDATANANQIILYTTSTGSPGETLFVRAGNVVQANINGGGIVANNVTFKLGGAYKTNDFAVSLNGASAVTDTSGSVPTVDRMFIGSSVNQSNFWLNGHIRRITYYPRRLPDATLQQITS